MMLTEGDFKIFRLLVLGTDIAGQVSRLSKVLNTERLSSSSLLLAEPHMLFSESADSELIDASKFSGKCKYLYFLISRKASFDAVWIVWPRLYCFGVDLLVLKIIFIQLITIIFIYQGLPI